MKIALVADGHHDAHSARVLSGALLPALQHAGLEFEPWEHGRDLPQSRAALHLCDPDYAIALDHKRNFLISCRTRLGSLSPRQVGGFDFFACFAPDQAKQARAALAPFGTLVGELQAPPMPRFLACDTARPLLRVPGQPLRFLWHGSYRKEEWLFILHAWKQAFSENLYRDAHLTIVGQPSEGEEHFPHGLTLDRVNRTTDEDWADLYARTDVVIGTQVWGYGLGVPFLDAQASGCLLTAPKMGLFEGIVTGETAVVLEPTEPMAAGLRAIVEGWGTEAFEVTRIRGIAAARARSWDDMADKLVAQIKAMSYNGMKAVS